MAQVSQATAIVGAADHCGWAVLVTIARDGTLIDRRRVELVAPDLPQLPHHHDCQGLPLPEAVQLVERVRALPGVTQAGIVRSLPLAATIWITSAEHSPGTCAPTI